MTRRLLFASLFLGLALSSTGCCGAFRNFVYRVRHHHGCLPAFGGPCCEPAPCFAPSCSPSYSIGVVAPVGDPGCTSCGASAVPMAAPYGMNAPTAPAMAYNAPVVPPSSATLTSSNTKTAGVR